MGEITDFFKDNALVVNHHWHIINEVQRSFDKFDNNDDKIVESTNKIHRRKNKKPHIYACTTDDLEKKYNERNYIKLKSVYKTHHSSLPDVTDYEVVNPNGLSKNIFVSFGALFGDERSIVIIDMNELTLTEVYTWEIFDKYLEDGVWGKELQYALLLIAHKKHFAMTPNYLQVIVRIMASESGLLKYGRMFYFEEQEDQVFKAVREYKIKSLLTD